MQLVRLGRLLGIILLQLVLIRLLAVMLLRIMLQLIGNSALSTADRNHSISV